MPRTMTPTVHADFRRRQHWGLVIDTNSSSAAIREHGARIGHFSCTADR